MQPTCVGLKCFLQSVVGQKEYALIGVVGTFKGAAQAGENLSMSEVDRP